MPPTLLLAAGTALSLLFGLWNRTGGRQYLGRRPNWWKLVTGLIVFLSGLISVAGLLLGSRPGQAATLLLWFGLLLALGVWTLASEGVYLRSSKRVPKPPAGRRSPNPWKVFLCSALLYSAINSFMQPAPRTGPLALTNADQELGALIARIMQVLAGGLGLAWECWIFLQQWRESQRSATH